MEKLVAKEERQEQVVSDVLDRIVTRVHCIEEVEKQQVQQARFACFARLVDEIMSIIHTERLSPVSSQQQSTLTLPVEGMQSYDGESGYDIAICKALSIAMVPLAVYSMVFLLPCPPCLLSLHAGVSLVRPPASLELDLRAAAT